MNIIVSRSEQEKESERSLNFSVLGQMVPALSHGFLSDLGQDFSALTTISTLHLFSHAATPFAGCCQDVQRKTQRQPCLHKTHYISACVSKPNEHIEVYLEVPFPHHSPTVQRTGNCVWPHGRLNKAVFYSSTPSIFLLQFCQMFPIPRNCNSECGGGYRVLAQEVVQMLFLKEDDHDRLCE